MAGQETAARCSREVRSGSVCGSQEDEAEHACSSWRGEQPENRAMTACPDFVEEHAQINLSGSRLGSGPDRNPDRGGATFVPGSAAGFDGRPVRVLRTRGAVEPAGKVMTAA